MTYLDLQRGVEWIIVHWPKDGERAWSGWEAMGDEFLGFTAGAFMEACNTLFRSGLKYAPGPSEMLKAIRPVQARRIEYGTDELPRSCDTEQHAWADPLPIDALYEGGWVKTCVVCGATQPASKCQHVAVNKLTGRCVYCLAENVKPNVETVAASEALI